MTNEQLINKLQKYPKDADVRIAVNKDIVIEINRYIEAEPCIEYKEKENKILL